MQEALSPGLDPGMELLQVSAALDVLATLHYAAEDGGQEPEIDRYGMGYLLSLLGQRANHVAVWIGEQQDARGNLREVPRPKPRAVK